MEPTNPAEAATNKTDLWERLGKTDPTHTKQFKRAGGFSGTAIKPMFSYKRMTEEFGPCGIGWGVDKPEFQVVTGENKEVLVYCTVSVWYNGDPDMSVYGVGGDKVVTYIKANEQYKRPERWENDDEAFKKAFTDAVTNALKLIGVGADVHMGMFDDSKYVNDMRAHFDEGGNTGQQEPPRQQQRPQNAQRQAPPQSKPPAKQAQGNGAGPIQPGNFRKMRENLTGSKDVAALDGEWKRICDWIGDNADPTPEQTKELSDLYHNRRAQMASGIFDIEADDIPF